jgi:hypothetical protein
LRIDRLNFAAETLVVLQAELDSCKSQKETGTHLPDVQLVGGGGSAKIEQNPSTCRLKCNLNNQNTTFKVYNSYSTLPKR